MENKTHKEIQEEIRKANNAIKGKQVLISQHLGLFGTDIDKLVERKSALEERMKMELIAIFGEKIRSRFDGILDTMFHGKDESMTKDSGDTEAVEKLKSSDKYKQKFDKEIQSLLRDFGKLHDSIVESGLKTNISKLEELINVHMTEAENSILKLGINSETKLYLSKLTAVTEEHKFGAAQLMDSYELMLKSVKTSSISSLYFIGQLKEAFHTAFSLVARVLNAFAGLINKYKKTFLVGGSAAFLGGCGDDDPINDDMTESSPEDLDATEAAGSIEAGGEDLLADIFLEGSGLFLADILFPGAGIAAKSVILLLS